MKIRNILSISIIFTSIISFGSTANFSIFPEQSGFVSKCETSVDIMIDSEGEDIAASDMILLFNTGEILPLCFIPGEFLNIGGGMEIDGNKIKVTSYQYPGYSKGKGKFGTLIFRSFSTTKETILYFDVKKIGIKETFGDSNISRPGGGDILDKAGFAKYTFEEGVCKEIDDSKFKNCKTYNNSGGFETFIKNYESEVKNISKDYTKIIIRFLLLFIIAFVIIRKFSIKHLKPEGKK